MKPDLKGRAIKLSFVDPSRVTFQKTLPMRSKFAPTRTICAAIHDVMLRTVRSREKQVVARAATWGLIAYDDRATGVVLIKAADRKQSLEDILFGEITVLVDLEHPLHATLKQRDASRFPHRLGMARASLIKPWIRTFDEARAASDGYFSMTGAALWGIVRGHGWITCRLSAPRAAEMIGAAASRVACGRGQPRPHVDLRARRASIPRFPP